MTSSQCKFCTSNAGKYVCPRCNILYCSVACYRSPDHASCSEEFYKDCIQEEILASGGEEGRESSRSMFDILQRMHQQQDEEDKEEVEIDSDDSSGGAEDDLAARLEGVNLDDADSVWEKLSRSEKEEFQRILNSGDPGGIVPPWEPWWTHRIVKPLVVELDDNNEEDLSFMKSCPPHRSDIPALSNKNNVNPAVQYGLENTILAYALVTRYFTGDHQGELREEASQSLLQLSTCLGRGQNFIDRDTALASVTLEASQGLGLTEESIQLAKEDLECILCGPSEELKSYYLLSALADCTKLLSPIVQSEGLPSVKGEFSQRFNRPAVTSKKWTKKQVNLAIKKIEFYIAWTQCQS